jgi:glycerophosphoryl diester phosphodiesterase
VTEQTDSAAPRSSRRESGLGPDLATLLREPLRWWRSRPIALLGAYALSQLLVAATLVPLAAWATARLVRGSGAYVVANERIVAFVLSPGGLVALGISSAALLAGIHAGRAGAVLLATGAARSGWGASAQLVGSAPRLVALAARQIAGFSLVALPFAAGVGLVAWLVLRGIDPYWLVRERPPRLWIGLASVFPLLACAALFLARRAGRESLALPILLVEGRSSGAAIAAAAELHRQGLGRLGRARVVATLLVIGGAATLGAIVHWATLAAIPRVAEGWPTILLLAASVLLEGAIAAATGLLLVVNDGVIAAAAYRAARQRQRPAPSARPAVGRVALALAIALAVAAGLALTARGLIGKAQPVDVVVVAHRGASRVAPENTIAAIRAAVESKADGVELDVQRASDGALVIVHDSDFRRLTGDGRRVRDLDLAEIRELDVGRWFSPDFEGTRVPTLREAIEAVRDDDVFLNIELKTEADAEALVRAVVAEVRSAGFVERVILTSLDTQVLTLIARIGPEFRRGAILSALVGDPNRIDADLLAVRAAMVGEILARDTRERSLGVHAWTVPAGAPTVRMALLGADGVLTDDPAGVRATLEEFAQTTEAERLLLALRERLLR